MTENPYEELPQDLFFSKSLLGKTCAACHGAYPYSWFQKDSSIRDGYALICRKCASTPRENTADALARIKETNYNSAAIQSQRRPDELDYLERNSVGRSMYHTEFIRNLRKILGPRLIVAPAYFLNEVCLYIKDSSQVDTNGVAYLGYLETDGKMQEFSEYTYDEYSRVTGESKRGYRGILTKLILQGYCTEQEISKVFGPCDEKIWCKTLYNFRNRKG